MVMEEKKEKENSFRAQQHGLRDRTHETHETHETREAHETHETQSLCMRNGEKSRQNENWSAAYSKA